MTRCPAVRTSYRDLEELAGIELQCMLEAGHPGEHQTYLYAAEDERLSVDVRWPNAAACPAETTWGDGRVYPRPVSRPGTGPAGRARWPPKND